jgi:hypothetical protein
MIGSAFAHAMDEKILQLTNYRIRYPPLILTAIHTVPSPVYSNGTFMIVATLINNSTSTLMISNNDCSGQQLTATFDKNVDVKEGSHFCNLQIAPFFLMKSNVTKTITTGNKNDPHSDHYTAKLDGQVVSILKVEYQVKNDNIEKGFASCMYEQGVVSPCIFKFPILSRVNSS